MERTDIILQMETTTLTVARLMKEPCAMRLHTSMLHVVSRAAMTVLQISLSKCGTSLQKNQYPNLLWVAAIWSYMVSLTLFLLSFGVYSQCSLLLIGHAMGSLKW